VVDCWQCQTAVTPILDRVRRPGVVLATGTQAGVSGVGGIVVLAFSSRHVDTPFKDVRSPTVLSDTASLRGRTGRLRRTVRNPLCSDRFLSVNTAACYLNVPVGNSGQAFERWNVSLSDGAYPRPEGRGIAPAPPIRGGQNTAYPLEEVLHSGVVLSRPEGQTHLCALDRHRALKSAGNTIPVRQHKRHVTVLDSPRFMLASPLCPLVRHVVVPVFKNPP